MPSEFTLPIELNLSPENNTNVPLELKKFELQFTNMDIFHFYFQVNSALEDAKTESLIQLVQNLAFDDCSIVTNRSDTERQKIVNTLNEFGLDASVASAGYQLNFVDSLVEAPDKRNGVHLVINLEIPDQFEDYLFKTSKMTGFRCTNFIINVVNSVEVTSIQEMVAKKPFVIHSMPADMMIWRDIKKLRAYAEQQTHQQLLQEENKNTASTNKTFKSPTGKNKRSTNPLVHSTMTASLETSMKVLTVSK